MATLYNKTALKKIKKDDLIQMFLDQQADNNKLKEELEETIKLKDHFRQKWIEKTREFVRLVPRTKRGLDARNSRGY